MTTTPFDIHTNNISLNMLLGQRIRASHNPSVYIQLYGLLANNTEGTNDDDFAKAAALPIHELFSMTSAMAGDDRNYLDVMSAIYLISKYTNTDTLGDISKTTFRNPRIMLESISFWLAADSGVVANLPIKDIEESFKDESTEYVTIAKTLASQAQKQFKLFNP